MRNSARASAFGARRAAPRVWPPTTGNRPLVAAARRYLGVRWRHLGRDPARGLDCVGLVLRAAQDVSLLAGVAYASYGRRPEGHRLTGEIARHAHAVPMAEMAPGDVLTFAGVERLPCHLAIVTGTQPATIIHSWAEHGRVAEHGLAGFSGGTPTGCWRIHG